MRPSAAELRRIATRAATLGERIAGGHLPVDGGGRDARLARWRRLVARDDPALFATRLAHLGTTPDEVRAVVGETRLPAGTPTPEWVGTLAERLDRLDGASAGRDAENPLPFEEVLTPLVAGASASARRRFTGGRLPPAALAGWERWLLRSLATRAAPVLDVEFEIFKLGRESPIEALVRRARLPGDTAHLDAFLDELSGTGLWRVFAEYPVLARLVGRLLDDWEDTVVEFEERLERDAAAVGMAFGDGADPGRVSAVHAGLSDRHAGGRAVAMVHFESGLAAVYKPKDVATEVAWNGVLAWWAAAGGPHEHRRLRVLSRDGYGWVERAVAEPCSDAGGPARYYRRAGALLCLVYLLHGTDFHQDNVVAAGDHPVLVDTETLFHPVPAPPEGDDATTLAHVELRRSVMATGLLPRWALTPGGSGFDPAGLGDAPGADPAIAHEVWHDIGHDDQHRRRAVHAPATRDNAPVWRGQQVPPDRHVDDVAAGFAACYRFVSGRHDEFVRGPLPRFASVAVRSVLRPTATYSHILERACSPGWLRDGADHDIALDALAAGPLLTDATPGLWQLVESERASLHRGDVPKFMVDAATTDVRFPAGLPIGWPYPVEAGLPAVKRRVRSMSDQELRRQLDFVRGAFHARAASRDAGARRAGSMRAGADPADAQLVAEAAAIADEIAQQAIRAADGSATWVVPDVLPYGIRYALRPMGTGLYTGAAGVALFLAAAARHTGSKRHATLALAALASALPALDRRHEALGGVMGLGSVAYAAAEVGRLLGRPALADRAREIVAAVDQEALDRDPHNDLAGGAAGALAVLVGLRDGDPAALRAARLVGDHLLARRTGEPAAWKAAIGVRLAGLAHGAAGIAHALLALADRTGDSRYRDAALEGLRFERELYDDSHGNWRDVRPDVPQDGRPPMVAWCNGAPGVALGRLWWRDVDALVAEDLERALAATVAYPLDGLDHLCCGNFGRIDVLLTAGIELGRADLVDEARRRAGAVIGAAAAQGGRYRFVRGGGSEVDDPSFFRGLAGIGYVLLRLADPARHPSVLALSPLGGWRRRG